ncbi:MAG: glutathione S-transferase family protein [Cyanobacteria bacterium P01_A01_bin.114]
MITLYQYPSGLGIRNVSPFCLKLETYLRMADLPYQLAPDADVRKSPKGKLPYIQDQGRTIADSGLIIDYLKATYGDPLDGHLSVQERATVLAFRRLMEEHLYWVMVYSRWVEDSSWQIIRQAYFKDLPPVLNSVVPMLVRRQVLRDLHGQGVSRHSREDIYGMGIRNLQAVSDLLADKPFLMGDRPTSLDATGYGFTANLLKIPLLASPLTEYAKGLNNIVAYCDRMAERYWADLKPDAAPEASAAAM